MAGMAGIWHLSSDSHMSSRIVAPAYAETSVKATEGKPWTASELEEIAKLYESAADTVEDEALQYERTAASITPLTDTKGFRRSALKTAAQERQKQSAEILQLVTKHQRNAESVTAQQTQQ